LTTSALPVGTDKITAVYAGDGDFQGSGSAVDTHKVNGSSIAATSALAASSSGSTGSSDSRKNPLSREAAINEVFAQGQWS
jgi:hypothetical protein